MITKFQIYNESVKSLLVGPTEWEVMNNLKYKNPNKILEFSLENEFYDGIELALDRGANIPLTNKNIETIIRSGKIKLLDYILKKQGRHNGNYMVQLYSSTNRVDIIKFLIDKGIDIHIGNGLSIRTDYPLCLASACGNTDMAKLFLDNGADIHTNNDLPLRWAVECGKTETVKFLLDNGANANANFGFSNPIPKALENGHIDTVELLKKYMDKSTNESIKSLLVGPTKEEMCIGLINGKLKGLIDSIPESPEDFFNQMKEGCIKMGNRSEYGQYGEYGKNGVKLFNENLKYKVLNVSNKYIWSILLSVYDINLNDIHLFIKDQLKDTKWNDFMIGRWWD